MSVETSVKTYSPGYQHSPVCMVCVATVKLHSAEIGARVDFGRTTQFCPNVSQCKGTVQKNNANINWANNIIHCIYKITVVKLVTVS
jgi:hypothetical protein